MALPITTLILIVLLLPGVAFFYASSFAQRQKKEIVRTNVIGDVAWAVVVSMAVHIATYTILKLSGRHIDGYLRYIFLSDPVFAFKMYFNIEKFVRDGAIYIFLSTIVGGVSGLLYSKLIPKKFLGWLSLHKWSLELVKDGDALIITYVMTNISENNSRLMYKGILSEYFMDENGVFTYIVLSNVKKYFFKFTDEKYIPSKQMDIFGKTDSDGGYFWNYLVIPGSSIENVLFERSDAFQVTEAANDIVDRALQEAPNQNDSVHQSDGVDVAGKL